MITPANAVPIRIRHEVLRQLRSRKIATGRSTSETEKRDDAAHARHPRGVPALDAERRHHDAPQGDDRRCHADDRDQEQQPMAGTSGGTIESGNQVAASSGIFATSGRVRKNSPIPAMTPMTLTNSASTAASRVTCEAVAPDQSQRGQSLLAPCGRQPRRRRDEDRDRDEGTDDREHDHQDRHQREVGRFGVGSNAMIGAAPSVSTRRRLDADHGDELVRATEDPRRRSSRRPSRSGRRAGRAGTRLHECSERRRDDGLTGSGDAIDARRGRWCVDQPARRGPVTSGSPCVDVDVRPDEEAGVLGRPALRHDEARSPGRAAGHGRRAPAGTRGRTAGSPSRPRPRTRSVPRPIAAPLTPAQGESEPEPDHDRSAPLRRPSRTMISRWA